MKNHAEKLYAIRDGQLVEITPEPPKQPEPVKQTEGKRLLSVTETVKALGLGRSKTTELLVSGEIKSIKVGKIWRVPFWAIDEFVNKARG